jgi:hypothetical protein
VRHWFWRPSLPPASYAPSKHTIKLATNHGHSACRRDSSASDSLRTWDQAEHGTCATKGRDDDEMRGSEPRNEMRGPRRPTKRSKAPLSKPPTPHQPRPQAPYLSSRAQALMERSPFAPRHMERHVERAEFYNRSQRERLMEHLRAEVMMLAICLCSCSLACVCLQFCESSSVHNCMFAASRDQEQRVDTRGRNLTCSE